MNIVFFGSFQHYSTLILASLIKHPTIKVIGIVTTPPAPAGRKQVITKTHTHLFAEEKGIPVFTPEELDQESLKSLESLILNQESSVDYFLTAGYSKLLPPSWLKYPMHGSINLHFSLLPKFRGANPAEWAILLNETVTGISLISMSSEFDTGAIYRQEEIAITPSDTRESVYLKLYELGAAKLPEWLTSDLVSTKPKDQEEPPTPPANRFIRAHGFIHWQNLTEAMTGKPLTVSYLNTRLKNAFNHLNLESKPNQHAAFIERAVRALYGFPGVWTYVPTISGKKRLKIHSAAVVNDRLILHQVQLEGSSPAAFNQIKNQIMLE